MPEKVQILLRKFFTFSNKIERLKLKIQAEKQ